MKKLNLLVVMSMLYCISFGQADSTKKADTQNDTIRIGTILIIKKGKSGLDSAARAAAEAKALKKRNSTNIAVKPNTEKPTHNISLAATVKPAGTNIEDVNILTKQSSNAGVAMLTSHNDDEVSNNRILYIDEEYLQKTKAGAFFKKMKRVIARRTNIEIGNSVHIANFEIALK